MRCYLESFHSVNLVSFEYVVRASNSSATVPEVDLEASVAIHHGLVGTPGVFVVRPSPRTGSAVNHGPAKKQHHPADSGPK